MLRALNIVFLSLAMNLIVSCVTAGPSADGATKAVATSDGVVALETSSAGITYVGCYRYDQKQTGFSVRAVVAHAMESDLWTSSLQARAFLMAPYKDQRFAADGVISFEERAGQLSDALKAVLRVSCGNQGGVEFVTLYIPPSLPWNVGSATIQQVVGQVEGRELGT